MNMKKIILVVSVLALLQNITVNAQWQRFNFPNLKPYGTNSKYMYSIPSTNYYLNTTNDWQSWDTVYTAFTISNFVADSTGQVLIAEYHSGHIYKIYLSQHQTPFHIIFNDTLYIYNLYLHKNYIYLLTQGPKSYRSTDNGNTFVPIYPINFPNYDLFSIKAACDSVVYVNYTPHFYPNSDEESVSYDAGNTWYWYNNCDPTAGKIIYVPPYIFLGQINISRSNDGGHTFSSCSPALNVRSFAYRNGVLLAGTNNLGVYATTNKGDTWIGFNDGLDTLCCNAQVAVTDSFYYVTLNDTVTYRRPTHDLMAIANLATEPLISLFPNPATNYLTIKSSITPPFTFQLYNLQGSLQKEGKVTASQIEINVADLPKGMYVLKVVSEKQTIAKKIVLQ